MSLIRPDNFVRILWAGDHRFDAGRPGGPHVRIDASAETGPSPVDAVLIGLGTCTSVDVVDILAKRRTPVTTLNVDVQAERRETSPRRVLKAHLIYHIDGLGIEREHAERAVELAVTKYCSVRDSFDPAIPVTWSVVLNGA
ncbi:MAG: OsmC family protein [Gemmatimonadaceae bacterium]|nr:OsmC family protein [Gemmatimonadaceae bacterium]